MSVTPCIKHPAMHSFSKGRETSSASPASSYYIVKLIGIRGVCRIAYINFDWKRIVAQCAMLHTNTHDVVHGTTDQDEQLQHSS